MTVPSRPRTLRTAFAALATGAALALSGLAAAPAQAGPAQAAPAPAAPATATVTTAWIRLAHLSPDTGPVDVWLAPVGGKARLVLRKASYGTLSAYQSLRPGFYAVAMRRAGAEASAPALISSTVDLRARAAYTVAAVGPADRLTSTVVSDDLAAPPTGQSRVRLLQGSTVAPAVDVYASGGRLIAEDARYGTATGYATVPGGRWQLDVRSTSGAALAAMPAVDLRPGTVQSLLVLDGPQRTVRVRVVQDAASMARMPSGGVETGGGGSAPRSGGGGGVVPVVCTLAAALLQAVVGGRRRRA